MNKKGVLTLLKQTIESVHPAKFMSKYQYNNNILTIYNNKDKKINLKITGRIFVIGAGKASGAMAKELERIIGAKNITAGQINTTKKYQTKKINITLAGHPLPNKAGINGTKKILELKEKYNITKKDTVICLLSGGASALLTQPTISLEKFRKLNDELIKSKLTITQINNIRKKHSKVKGGELAKHFFPAKVISLIISDVVGNDIRTIGSGPTAIRKVKNIIISDNNSAIDFAKNKLKKEKVKILKRNLEGDSETQAKKYAQKINKSKQGVYILGGETTLNIPKKHGKGGRNQHFVTALNKYLKGTYIAASIGTDGQDYIKGVAGGIIESSTPKENIDEYLKERNSYNYLKKNEGLIKMNHTGTNVCDLIIIEKK